MKTTLNSQLSIFNCLLALLLLLATAPAFAQMTVCAGQGFMITSKADAQSISGGVTYTWQVSVDDGSYTVVPDQTAASLPVPLGKSAGTYAYVRYAAGDACPGGVSTTPYTVLVKPVPTISPFPPIHAVPGTTVTLTASGDYTYGWSTGSASQSITVTAPEDGSSDTYSCTATNVQGCSTSATASVIGTNFYSYSSTTWTYGSRTWSHLVVYEPDDSECKNALTDPAGSVTEAANAPWYMKVNGYLFYSWYCINAIGNTKLCPSPWRVPVHSETSTLLSNGANLVSSLGGKKGYYDLLEQQETEIICLWSGTEYPSDTTKAYTARASQKGSTATEPPYSKHLRANFRCVK